MTRLCLLWHSISFPIRPMVLLLLLCCCKQSWCWICKLLPINPSLPTSISATCFSAPPPQTFTAPFVSQLHGDKVFTLPFLTSKFNTVLIVRAHICLCGYSAIFAIIVAPGWHSTVPRRGRTCKQDGEHTVLCTQLSR